MNEINFLPLSFRQKQAGRRRRLRRAGVLIVLSLVLVGWWFSQASQTASMRRDAEMIEDQLSAAREQHTEIIQLREHYRTLSNQVRVQRELAQPVNHTQVLAMLGQLLPETVAMTDVEMVTRRPPPRELKDPAKAGKVYRPKDEPPPNRINIEFEGIAPDDLTVANVVAAISESPLFESVRLHSSRNVKRFGLIGRKFRLTTRVLLDREYRPVAEKELAHVR